MLGEFGPEVIKVELPGTGDPMRTLGEEREGIPLLRLQESHNKYTITCNLRDPEGQGIIRDLVRAGYDIVVENFRPGMLERWNLGYESLKAIDDGLIMWRSATHFPSRVG
jgi:formyl-CoA transferase